jgi:hypothetical protein
MTIIPLLLLCGLNGSELGGADYGDAAMRNEKCLTNVWKRAPLPFSRLAVLMYVELLPVAIRNAPFDGVDGRASGTRFGGGASGASNTPGLSID